MSPKLSRRRKFLAFAPALVVIAATAVVASGISVIPGATAANTVTVNGTVTASMSLASDTSTASCGGGTPGILGVGDFSAGTFIASGACVITYASNDPAGAHVTIVDSDATAPFFCTAPCTNGSNNTVENATLSGGGNVGTALGNDQFGVSLRSTSGVPLPGPGANFSAADATPTGPETIWAPVGTAVNTVCTNAGATTTNQTCGITFGVDGQGATQTSGSYSGVANLVAVTGP